jgi:ribosomal protein L14E/L6E/L27E
MEIQKGLVVRSKAGRDKTDFLVVIDLDEEYAYLCDGVKRPILNLKKKKHKHLAPTNKILNQNEIKTNKDVKKALYDFRKQTNNL